MSGRGAFSTLPCVTFTRLLPGPIERVWAFIAETRHLPVTKDETRRHVYGMSYDEWKSRHQRKEPEVAAAPSECH